MKHVDMSHYFEGFEKSKRSLAEEEILAFWEQNSIFKKTLEKPAPAGEYIFYEGPPTANGRPGIHHFLARSFKDAIPRYKTMRGYHVERKAGWDTHGLPVELQVEKKLGLNSKHEIADYGLEKFNDACKESVWEYTSEWEAMTKRMAYWVDMENPYITYETPYIESVWNILKKVSDDGLLYKDFRITPWCPRCGTTLSSHELAQGYEDVKDLSVTAAFEVINPMEVFPNITGSVYILAWTTTPWTLFGNVALAVGADLDYIACTSTTDLNKTLKNSETVILKTGVTYILSKTKFEMIKSEGDYFNNINEIKGKDLEGISYKPLFNYAAEIIKENSTTQQFEKAYKIHAANFVTTTDGTGVVHTAVMYGADDFDLGTAIGLPKFHMVKQDGTYIEGLDHFSGRFVKDEEVAIDVIKALAQEGNLFSKLKYEHSYPHCWRCKTPIIYYARDSWYIEMTKLQKQIVEKNETINWNPSHIKDGRFGEWLRNLKDWSLSRERYWGTPLPVWVSPTGKRITIGSLAELTELSTKPTTEFILIRHGFGTHLEKGIMSGDINNDTAVLTQEGISQVKNTAQAYKDIIASADIIYVSPFARTQETLTILQQELTLAQEVVVDARLLEVNFGTFNGSSHDKLAAYFAGKDEFETSYPEGESLRDVQYRVAQFVAEVQEKHAGQKVLVVSHDDTLSILAAICDGITTRIPAVECFEPAQCKIKTTTKLPVNHQGEVDLHKPFIDTMSLFKDGEEYTRVPEVIDCWFDSGAMPYAQYHIMAGEVKNNSSIISSHNGIQSQQIYPADYITEGLDQTRGWFYTLLAIATLLGKEAPYKNVICLGLLLDDKGQKMSKSKGNIVSPWKIFSGVGSDVARMWLYGVNQPGESKMFDLNSVQDLERKLFVILENCLEFYKLSPDTQTSVNREMMKGASYMDQWLLQYTNVTKKEITDYLEAYDLFNATRTIRDFVTELSQWYVRRSRESLKEETQEGAASRHVFRIVLRDVALLLAPFAPFHSEKYFAEVKFEADPISVHLACWPEITLYKESTILEDMKVVRNVVTSILFERTKVSMNVRQPLASAEVQLNLNEEQKNIIAEETNIKTIFAAAPIDESVKLNTELTDDLILEGLIRELTRAIQSKRKNLGMTVDQAFEITIKESELVNDIKKKFADEILKKTKTTLIVVSDIENPETITSTLGDIHIA